MYSVFIDFSHDLSSYEFFPGEKFGADIVSRLLGRRMEFVCNHYARISDGNVYEAKFDNHEDAIAFILKCEYNTIDKNKIDEYRNRRQ